MSYFNRQEQLTNTLLSIKDNVDIVIVDDGSSEDIILPDTDLNITVLKTSLENKTWNNPEPSYNRGILYSLNHFSPDIIMLQNPECLHVGSVIKYVDENITDDNYISFGCFSAGKDVSLKSLLDGETIKGINRGATYDGDNAWYNHPHHRPVAFDFCSAISVSNMMKLNGYDERFSSGYAFGDNYLLHRIKNLRLNVEITENPFVIHQWHYNISYPERGILYRKNMDLYNELSRTSDVRAVHLITPDFETVIN